MVQTSPFVNGETGGQTEKGQGQHHIVSHGEASPGLVLTVVLLVFHSQEYCTFLESLQQWHPRSRTWGTYTGPDSPLDTPNTTLKVELSVCS